MDSSVFWIGFIADSCGFMDSFGFVRTRACMWIRALRQSMSPWVMMWYRNVISIANRKASQCTEHTNHGRKQTNRNTTWEHLNHQILVQTFRLALTASVMVRKLDQKCWCNIRVQWHIGKVLAFIVISHNTQQCDSPAPQMFNVEKWCS